MKNDTQNSVYLNELPNYIEITESKLKPFYHTDLKNTLENIVLKDCISSAALVVLSPYL